MSMLIHHLLDQRVKETPTVRALTDTIGHDWSYQDLHDQVVKLAEEMADLGVRAGDRVLVIMENCAPVVASLFAASRLGAAVIPFNARQTEAEITRVVDHASPALVLFTTSVSQNAKTHADKMGAQPTVALSGHLQAFVSKSDPEPVLSDVATILYTTGTTGMPKGVMLTHDNLVFGGGVSSGVRCITQADTLYGVLPMSHVFGLASVVMASVMSGASIRIEPRFSPVNLYSALMEGVTLLSSVPQMLAQLMQYTKEQGHDRLPVDTLRYISSGAAPLDIDWKRKAEAFFGLPLQNGYGMTEATAGICLTRHDTSNDDISVGQPFPGVGVKLDVAAPGAEGNIGEILVSGGGVMKGYFRNDPETAAAFAEAGWLRTGDLGRFDDDDNLHIMGRSKELIIHGGFNVYPPEVEAALNDHPQVIQCAVIGVLEDGDEQVCAFVEASKSDWPTEADLRQFSAKNLAGYKRPSRIVIVDKLPSAATGKILKSALPALLDC